MRLAVPAHWCTIDTMHASPDACLARALASLDGLSVGDAFGERLFGRPHRIAARAVPDDDAWRWTDDTAMALTIVEALAATGAVDADALATGFARRYEAEPWRGYGGTAHSILTEIADGVPWRVAAQAPYGGQGSKGNGSAMRVAPLGAYFAHDLDRAAAAAAVSAAPTHRHREGEAGAIAIAVVAAMAARMAAGAEPASGARLLDEVYQRTPTSLTRDGIELAMRTPMTAPVPQVAARLGNGARVLCEDTVPLCVWLAARHLGAFEEAMWQTASAVGDLDTNCAIVGGILAAGGAAPPATWLARREPLPSLG